MGSISFLNSLYNGNQKQIKESPGAVAGFMYIFGSNDVKDSLKKNKKYIFCPESAIFWKKKSKVRISFRVYPRVPDLFLDESL